MKKVLLVEDSENIRLLQRTLLTQNGFEVEEAPLDLPEGEPPEFFQKLSGFDCVVCDGDLGRWFDGADVVGWIRDSRNNIPILIVASSSSLVTKMQAKGASGFIPKPFVIDEFVEAVKNLTAGE